MKVKRLVIAFACGILSMTALGACSIIEKFTGTGETEVATEAETDTQETVEEEAPEQPESYGSVELANYIGVEIALIDTTVTDEEVQTELDAELASDPTIVEVTDRAVQTGDTVNIDYVGTKDGVEFDGGSATGYDLTIGSGAFIDGFEDGLIGANIGDTVTLNLTFPEDYSSEDLAGAAVVFTVTVNAITYEEAAELTDAWVEQHTSGEYTTVAEFEESLRKTLQESKNTEVEQRDQYNAITTVINASTFEINADATAYELYNIVNPIETMVAQYGMTMEDYASMYGMTLEEMNAQFSTQAETYVKQKLTAEAIFVAENMEVTDEDYAYLSDLYSTDLETLISNYGQESIDESAKMYKVVNFIASQAVRSADVEDLTMTE